MKKSILTMSVGLLALGSVANAQSFVRAYESTTTDIPAPTTDVGDPEINSNVNHMQVIADVDTDGDNNAEIIVYRADAAVAGVPPDLYCIYIYEVDGTDDGYVLKYSDCWTQGDGGNFNEMGSMTVADLDNADGDEIIMIPSPRFGAGAPVANVVVWASSGDDAWGSANTAANDENSMEFFIGTAGATEGDSGTDTETQGSAVGDFDGDGTVELAFVSDRSNNLLISSVTSGTFVGGDAVLAIEGAALGGLGGSPYAVAPGDVNADGQLDILVGFYNNIGLGIYEGTAADTYAGSADLSPGPAAGDQLPKPECIIVKDFDSDGVADIYIADSRAGDIFHIAGEASGGTVADVAANTFSTFETAAANGIVDAGTDSNGNILAGQALSIGDSDGDGISEILYSILPDNGTSLDSSVVIYEYNTGTADTVAGFTKIDGATSGLTTTETIFDAATAYDGTSLDLDGDGNNEVVVITSGASEPALIVFEEAPASENDWQMFTY